MQEPEEGNDDEVNAVFIEGTVDGVSGVEDSEEVPQDGDIGGIGAAWRVVIVCEGLEEIFPQGMSQSLGSRLNWIRFAQVSDPLANGQ